jgi:PKD repeat protein
MVFGFPAVEAPLNTTQLKAQRHNGTAWVSPIAGQTATATEVTAPAIAAYGIYAVVDQAPLPVVADFTANSTSICAGETVSFTDESTGTLTTRNWNFTGGTPGTSTEVNPMITYDTEGTYDVVLTVSDGTTNDTKTKTAYIVVKAKPTVTVNDAAKCSGQSAILTATPSITGGAYLWANASETDESITVSPTSTQTYSVVYTLNGCSANGSGTVTISSSPTATVSGGGAICPGGSSTINVALTGSDPWDITYTDGTTPVTVSGILTSPYSFTTTTAGTYTVSAVSNATCTGTSSGSAVVTIATAIAITNLIETCSGDKLTYVVSFTISGGDMSTYTVSGGTGTLNGSTFMSDPISSATMYTFTANDVNNCSSETVTNTVDCSCEATAAISGGGTICSGATATISIALAGTAPWSVTYTNGTTPTTANTIASSPYTFTTSTAGTYTVSSVSDANCKGISSGSAEVIVNQSPVVSVNDESICSGNSITLTALSSPSGGSFLWSQGQATATITVSPPVTTSYTVTYSLNGCSDTKTAQVFVYATPPAPLITRNGMQLTSDVMGGNQWYKNGAEIIGETSQTYNAMANGAYYSIVFESGCFSTSSNQIVIGDVGIDEINLNGAIVLSPNPTSGLVQLILPTELLNKLQSIKLVNSLGQTVMVLATTKEVIDLTGLEPGVYQLIMQFETGMASKRVVKN